MGLYVASMQLKVHETSGIQAHSYQKCAAVDLMTLIGGQKAFNILNSWQKDLFPSLSL